MLFHSLLVPSDFKNTLAVVNVLTMFCDFRNTFPCLKKLHNICFCRTVSQSQTGKTRNRGKSGKLFVNIWTDTDWRSNLHCLWLFFLFYSQRHKRNISKYCFSSVILLQAELHCFITTAKTPKEHQSKRKGIKHYILIDYSRQTRDQITVQNYCANPHPNNTYCEPRCSPSLIRKPQNTVAHKWGKTFTARAGQHSTGNDSLLQP